MLNVSEVVKISCSQVRTRPSFQPFGFGVVGQEEFPSGVHPIPLDRAVQKSKWASRLVTGISLYNYDDI